MSDDIPSCGNCRFARKDWVQAHLPNAELHCHRHAPRTNRLQGQFLIGRIEDCYDENGKLDMCEVGEPDGAVWYVQATGDETDIDGLWPLVVKHDWCGEWERGRAVYSWKSDE